MDFKYVSIDTIFAKQIRDIGPDINETDTIEYCGEALEFIGAIKTYEEAIAFIEIKNHQAKLPRFLHQIIQVAKNTGYSNYKECTPSNIVKQADSCCKATLSYGNACASPDADAVWLDCNGQPIVAYDLAYYRPYFDLKAEHLDWRSGSFYKQNFKPLRTTNNTLFNTLIQPEHGIGYTNIQESYNIVANSIIRTSFKDGQIAVAYYRQPVDPQTGYPMIPDNISYKTAIIKYIAVKLAEREFSLNREGSAGKLAKYEADWQWYCKQAGNAAMMPTGIDDYQDIHDQRNRLVPNYNSYYGFFGNLNVPERNMGLNLSGHRPDSYPNTIPETQPESNEIMNCPVPNSSNNVYRRKPDNITINGNNINRKQWINGDYMGWTLDVYVNGMNRWLDEWEYKRLPEGGFEIIADYIVLGDTDTIKIFPNKYVG